MSSATNDLAKSQILPTVARPGVWRYYLEQTYKVMPPDEKELMTEIEKKEKAIMAASPDEAQFLGWLCELIRAKRVIEVGVFRGSTTLSLAKAVGEGGVVVGLDVNEEFASIGKSYWEKAGVADRIDFRVGKALDSLQKMISDIEADTEGRNPKTSKYDLMFIDADKTGYDAYFELGLKLIRKNGVIAIDNTLWHGKLIDSEYNGDPDTEAMRTLNAKLAVDTRIKINMMSIADGVTLCRVL